MKRLLPIIAFYTLLACLALYMPIFKTADSVPGAVAPKTTDYYHSHWNYWWMRHALTTPGLTVYETDYVLAPYTSGLAYHTLTPFWFPLWALLEPVSGTVPAMMAICIASMMLTGTLFYLLLRREKVNSGLALVGGAMLALAPMMFNGVYWTNINLMGWFWLPALVLIWDQVARATTHQQTARALSWTIAMALACWGMVLTDLQYPLFASFIMVPYGLLTLWQIKHHIARARLILIAWGGLALASALALLWVAGPLAYLLNDNRTGFSPTLAENAVSIPFPEGYVWHINNRVMSVSLGAVWLPLVLIALACGFMLRHVSLLHPLPTRRWFWLALVFLPLVLSAGASITVAGVAFPLPYRWLHDSLGGMFRYPERFAPVILIPAIIFSLQTLTPWLAQHARWRKIGPVVLLFVVMLDSRMFSPFPIQPLPTPYTFYKIMGREPYDYVVVEVPTGASSGEGLVGEAVYATTQFYGLTHGKRMINGHLSRVNILHYWYLRTDDPLLSWLGQRRLLEPAQAESRLRQIIAAYPVGYIVVHTDMIERYTGASTVQEVVGYLNRLPDLLCPVFVEGTAVVYRTTWHPEGCPPRTPPKIAPGIYQIDIGSSGDTGFLGWGWHLPEEIVPGLTARWTGTHPRAEVYIILPPGDYSLTLAAQSFLKQRQVQLLMNGVAMGELTVQPENLSALTFPTPIHITDKNTTLTLVYDAPETPAGERRRPLALMVDWIRFEQTQ